jgi:glycosyltransferase involved in cell wall biosynthesis
VQAQHSGQIDLLGAVEDLAALFDRSRVFVAPTRYAAGIPHKVHQAASLGVPVVATFLLAQQLGWENERHLLVADSAEDFAAAVSRLFYNATLWETFKGLSSRTGSSNFKTPPDDSRHQLLGMTWK